MKLAALSLLLAALVAGCVTGEEDLMDDPEELPAEGDGKADGGNPTPSPVCETDGTFSINACAFMGTIAYAEGTNGRYDYSFGFHVFVGYDDHPRDTYCSRGLCSTAAGRYQFLAATWDSIKGDLPDFSPRSQDFAGIRLVKGRGVSNIDAIDTYAEFSTAIKKCNREWASLPGSPYGQPTHSMSQLWREFTRLRGN
jgi:lysozyme